MFFGLVPRTLDRSEHFQCSGWPMGKPVANALPRSAPGDLSSSLARLAEQGQANLTARPNE